MANTIAIATGCDSTRVKRVHRLGSESAEVEAATWRTFARAVVYRDGDGYVEVRRRTGLTSEVIHRFDFGPEREPCTAD